MSCSYGRQRKGLAGWVPSGCRVSKEAGKVGGIWASADFECQLETEWEVQYRFLNRERWTGDEGDWRQKTARSPSLSESGLKVMWEKAMRLTMETNVVFRKTLKVGQKSFGHGHWRLDSVTSKPLPKLVS